SPAEAHRWVVEELRNAIYRDQPSLLARFLAWLRDRFHAGEGGGTTLGVPSWVLYATALGVAVVIVAIVVRTVRRDPRRRGARRGGGDGVLGDDRRSAGQLRSAATEALAEARWGDAVMAGMRAVAAGVVERAVLEESPGRTAYELVGALAPHFPAQVGDLRLAAHHFDAVRYGHLPADEAAARQVVATDAAVATARPVFPETVAASVGGSW
ncbi:MAG: DUF4129 domain-containing protein, partial [Nostocoides sp.]